MGWDLAGEGEGEALAYGLKGPGNVEQVRVAA